MTGAARERGTSSSGVVSYVRDGYFHVLLSIAVFQGFAYTTQLIAAAVLSPEELSRVRFLEAIIGTFLPVALLGFPAVIIKEIAGARSLIQHKAIIRAVTKMAAWSICLAVVGAFVTLIFFRAETIEPWLSLSVLILAPATTLRLANAYLYGAGDFRRSVLACSCASVVLLVTIYLSMGQFGLAGWLFGRVVAELSFATIVVVAGFQLYSSRSKVSGLEPHPGGIIGSKNLLFNGLIIGLSSGVRIAVDNLPIFATQRYSFDIGFRGDIALATLIIQIAQLPVGALSSMVYARLSTAATEAGHFASILKSSAVISFVAALVVAIGCMSAASFVVPVLAGGKYDSVLPIGWILCFSAPFRSVVGVFGGALIALDRARLTLWINLFVLAVSCLSYVGVYSIGREELLPFVVVLGEVLYFLVTWYCLRIARGSATSTSEAIPD